MCQLYLLKISFLAHTYSTTMNIQKSFSSENYSKSVGSLYSSIHSSLLCTYYSQKDSFLIALLQTTFIFKKLLPRYFQEYIHITFQQNICVSDYFSKAACSGITSAIQFQSFLIPSQYCLFLCIHWYIRLSRPFPGLSYVCGNPFRPFWMFDVKYPSNRFRIEHSYFFRPITATL